MSDLSSPSQPQIEQLIARPREQRLREHKYRCAQAIVFGLPVIALQYFGRQLGGAEASGWVAVLQMILSGWIVYIAATGMITEGVIVLATKRRITLDFFAGAIAVLLEIVSIISAIALLARKSIGFAPKFHWVVILLILWGGARWFWLSTTTEKKSAGEFV